MSERAPNRATAPRRGKRPVEDFGHGVKHHEDASEGPPEPKRARLRPSHRTLKSNVFSSLWDVRYSGNWRSHFSANSKSTRSLERLVSRNLPGRLRECSFPDSVLRGFGKVFAAEWLDNRRFIAGTKDNSLLLMDNQSPSSVLSVELPQDPAQPFQDGVVANSGIHTIAVNRERSLLATGGANPSTLAIFSLPDLKPVHVGSGHTEWLFGAEFLSDYTIATGGRDGMLLIWQLGPEALEDNLEDISGPGVDYNRVYPVLCLKAASRAVRDLSFLRSSGSLAALTTDHLIKLYSFDTFQETGVYSFPQYHEMVCIAQDEDRRIFGFGSKDYFTLIDPRQTGPAGRMLNPVAGSGIRSLTFRGNTVVLGGGRGRITFRDLRMSTGTVETVPIQVRPMSSKCPGDTRGDYLTAGDGHWPEYNVQHFPWFNGSGQQAVFTLSYNPNGTSLLTGGGPLQSGLRGSYLATWQ